MIRKHYWQTALIVITSLPIVFSSPTALSSGLVENEGKQNIYLAQGNRQDQLRDLLRQGRAMVEAKEYEAASKVYQQAARLDSENPRIFSGIGYLEAQQGNYNTAVWAYRRAIELDPNNGEFYYALGHTLAKLEEYSSATTAYYRATELTPDKLAAYLGLGTVLLRQDDRAGALVVYNKLLEIEPNHPEANATIGSLLVQRGNYPRAITYLNKATQIAPENASAWFNLTTAYQQQGNFALAFQAIETFLRRYPQHPGGHYRKGKLLQAQGNIAAAESAYKQAITLDNQPTEALVSLGEVQLKQEEYGGAVTTYRRLRELLPDNPGVYYNLGLALKGKDKISEARQAFQSAYQLFREVQNQEGKDRSQMQLRNL